MGSEPDPAPATSAHGPAFRASVGARTYALYASRDQPLVAFETDGTLGVRAFTSGTGWLLLGPDRLNLGAGPARHPSLTVDGRGLPIVAWCESGTSSGIHVKR